MPPFAEVEGGRRAAGGDGSFHIDINIIELNIEYSLKKYVA